MKKIVIFGIILLFLLTLQTGCKEKIKNLESSSPFPNCPSMNECDLDCPNGTTQQKGSYERFCAKQDKTRHGPAIKWHDYTHPSGKGEYFDGKKEGKWIQWYPLGAIRKETHYKAGKMHGPVTSWYENKTQSSLLHYKNGLQTGTAKTWYKSGQIMMESQWSDGKEQGLKTLWHPKGIKQKKAQMNMGQECGDIFCWDLQGSPEPCRLSSKNQQECSQTQTGAKCTPCPDSNNKN